MRAIVVDRPTADDPTSPWVLVYQNCQHGASGSVMVGPWIGYWWHGGTELRIVQIPPDLAVAARAAIAGALGLTLLADVVAAEQDAAAESPL